MPGGTTEVGGNTKLQVILGPILASPSPNIAANTSVIATYTVNGLLVNDLIDVQLQTHTAGLSIGSTWCAANNVLTVQWVNSTVGAISTANFQTVIGVTRLENANLGLTAFPTAIV